MLSKAIEIATKAFQGVADANGNPYIDHAMRVMSRMDTEEEKIIAVLHDVVEDTDMTLHELQEAGFSRTVLETIGMLTKKPDMKYFDYIEDIHSSELASKVKIAELEDNQDIMRVRKMSFQTYTAPERVKKTLAILKNQGSGGKI